MTKYIITLSLLLTVTGIVAQDTENITEDTDNSNWHYVVEAYLMFPQMQGEIQLRNLPPVGVDASVSDIFSHLKMGAMLYLEANNGDWAISSDLVYMKLAQGAKGSLLVESGEVEVKETIWEVAGLKRVSPWLEVGIAGRLISIKSDINIIKTLPIGGSTAAGASLSKSWFDPVVVVRTHNDLNEKWRLDFRGDLGGFGIGSDFTWQIQANVGYKFSKLFHTMIGYRYIGIDYENGSGVDTFVYDVDTLGPVFRLGFNF